jgi:hypothetical protein
MHAEINKNLIYQQSNQSVRQTITIFRHICTRRWSTSDTVLYGSRYIYKYYNIHIINFIWWFYTTSCNANFISVLTPCSIISVLLLCSVISNFACTINEHNNNHKWKYTSYKCTAQAQNASFLGHQISRPFNKWY